MDIQLSGIMVFLAPVPPQHPCNLGSTTLMNFFRRHLFLLLLSGLLLAILFCLPPGAGRRLAGAAQLVAEPAAAFTSLSLRLSRALWGGLPTTAGTAELDPLRAELAATQLQLAAAEDKHANLSLENNLLRNRLRLAYKKETLTLVVAELLQRDFLADFHDQILINRGHNDGIRPGQLVATHRGLIGLIAETSSATSSVTLITSPKFTLACRIPARNLTGLLRGPEPGSSNSSTLALLLPAQELIVDSLDGILFDTVRPGDLVYTSKIDSRARAVNDILVGTVTRVEHDNAGAPALRLQPAESLSQLPFVHVILQ